MKPKQDDEFTASCFLVHHQSQLADEKMICKDCA